VTEPYYSDDLVTLYHGDCRDVIYVLTNISAVVSDPPYPNNAGHFADSVYVAEEICRTFLADRWLVFWNTLTPPPVRHPLVARHVWYRTNTNRPDNYESIYEFAIDGKKRASRVLPYAVIAEGLTGCYEATGHPTQKNVKLMRALILMTKGTIVDPFAGSGTTLCAAKDLGRKAIGVEIEERYCELAARRLDQGVIQFGEVS
jgi:DNA methylase